MDEKHTYARHELSATTLDTWDLESMKGNRRPHRPKRHAARPSRSCSSILLLILGIASIALLTIRFFPPTWTASLFKKHLHQPHIIQLTKLSPSLVPATTNNRRLVVVGDVHGCRDELEDLLKHIHYNGTTDHLILAGDMIDKGPSSHGVIKLARELGASCVRGNHEDKVLALRKEQDSGFSTADIALSQKKLATNTLASELSNKDIAWLQQCPLILEFGEIPSLPKASSVVVVHAGLVPGIPLLEQDPFAVMHMRSISKKHRSFQPNEGRDEGEPWYKIWNHEQDLLYSKGVMDAKMVIYGHDSRTGLNERKWSLGLDSGCVGGGKLSAVVVDNHSAKVSSVKCKNERQ